MSTTSAESLPVTEILREMRGVVGSLRAAAETLGGFPEMERTMRDRLLGVLGEETVRLSERMQALEASLRRELARTARAERQPIAVSVLLDELAVGLTALGLRCAAEPLPGALTAARLALPWEALRDEVNRFFAALRRGSRVGGCGIRARPADRHVRIDLFWPPEPADLGWLLDWQGEALGGGPPGQPAGGLRAIARAADGTAWFTLDRDGEAAHVRLLLPLADAAA